MWRWPEDRRLGLLWLAVVWHSRGPPPCSRFVLSGLVWTRTENSLSQKPVESVELLAAPFVWMVCVWKHCSFNVLLLCKNTYPLPLFGLELVWTPWKQLRKICFTTVCTQQYWVRVFKVVVSAFLFPWNGSSAIVATSPALHRVEDLFWAPRVLQHWHHWPWVWNAQDTSG